MLTMFEVEYYKPSGKLYSTEQLVTSCQWVEGGGAPAIPYMNDAVEAVKQLRVRGGLPGLQSGKWDGPIRVNHPLGFPVLIL